MLGWRLAVVLVVLSCGLAMGQDATPVSPPKVVRVSGALMAGQILTKVQPVYPGDLKVEGAVVLQALIGTDGTVQSLTVLSGSPLLATAALDAVRQWTYKPYLLNDEPVEVETPVTVNFSLGDRAFPASALAGQPSSAPCPAEPENKGVPGGATRLSASFMAGRILNHSSPVYPKDAKKKHIEGVVIVHAVIGKDGTMQTASVLCGDPIFQDSALTAVKQWTYKPYYLETGQTTAVETTITITYSFGNGPVPRPGSSSWINGLEVVEIASDAPELAGAKKEQPKYPKDARKAQVSGEVKVTVLIGGDGKVLSTKVISGPKMLQEAAENAVRRYRYPKYSVGGVPKMVRTVETVNFPLP